MAKTSVFGEAEHVLEAHTKSPFGIYADEQRHLGGSLKFAGKLGLSFGCAGEEAYAPDTVIVHCSGEFVGFFIVHVERHTHDHKLGDTLREGEGVVDRVDPIDFRVIESVIGGIEQWLTLEQTYLLCREASGQSQHGDYRKSLYLVHCLNIWSK